MLRNIANICVSIFGKYLQFWCLMYIWMICPKLYIIFYNILFNNNMIKLFDIYVITTGYLLHQINIHHIRKNNQHYMLAYTDLNNISIDNHKQEIFPTFMLADGVYITHSSNQLYVKVISNIQCWIPTYSTTT